MLICPRMPSVWRSCEISPGNLPTNALSVQTDQFRGVVEVKTLKQAVNVYQAVAFSGSSQFIVAAPAPLPRVLDNSTPHHVQIHIP